MIPSYTTGSAVAASPSISPTLHWGHILSTLSPHPWSNPQIYLWDNPLQLKMCSGVFWVCCFIKVFFSTTVLFILLCMSTNYLSLVTPLLNYSPSLASSPFTNTFPLFLVETCKAVSFRHWSRLVLQHPFRHQLGLQTTISHHDMDLSLNAFRELKNHLFILFNKSLLLQPRRREMS